MKSAATMKTSHGRQIGLDIFRIIAAFSVFLFHSELRLGCQYGIFTDFFSMGAVFMTGFFMLSGYVLYYVYEHVNLMEYTEWKKFYWKRFVSIVPVYWVVAILYVIMLGKESWIDNLLLIPVETLGAQATFATIFGISHNNATWFISCLLICYILYPFLQTVIKQMKRREKQFLVFVILILLLISPFVVWRFDLLSTYSNPFYRCLEFLLGIILGSFMAKKEQKNSVFFGWGSGIIAFILMIVGVSTAVRLKVAPGNYMLYDWIVLPLFAWMIASFGKVRIQPAKGTRLLLYFSDISFEFYLVQIFVWPTMNWIMRQTGISTNLFKAGVSLLICLGYGAVLHELVNKPVRKLLLSKNEN